MCWCCRKGVEKLDFFPNPSAVSASSRSLQLGFSEAEFQSVREAMLTRLQKLDSGEYRALVLAAAGLKRLGLEDRISQYFEPGRSFRRQDRESLAVQGRQDGRLWIPERLTIWPPAMRPSASRPLSGP